MCNCIKEKEAVLVEKGSYKGHEILFAGIPETLVDMGGFFVSKMFVAVPCVVDGFRKEKRVNLLFTYCPFCGVRYEGAAEEAEVKPEKAKKP